jgi:hypothetical protein
VDEVDGWAWWWWLGLEWQGQFGGWLNCTVRRRLTARTALWFVLVSFCSGVCRSGGTYVGQGADRCSHLGCQLELSLHVTGLVR